MDTVSKLSRYAAKIQSPIRVIGVPKTIDNDLVETDHTPGFGSAANLSRLQYEKSLLMPLYTIIKICNNCRNHGTSCRMADCCKCSCKKI